MTYRPNIPLSSDIPSQSQGQILTNFQQLNSIFALNHVTYDDAATANRGKHTYVTMVEQGSDPATATDEMALYTKAVAAVSQLFLRRENNGSVLQLTNVPISGVANGGTAGGTIFFLDLPEGLRIYSGQSATIPSSGGRTVVFPTPYSQILVGLATANDPNAVTVSCIQSTTTLTLRTSASVAVNWFAIGRL